MNIFAHLRPPYRLHHTYERMLGTEVEVQIVADSRAQAEAAEDAALSELERLRDIFNRFDPHSEFSRWLARPHERVSLSSELWEVLAQAEWWQDWSGGAFHAGADALGAVWRAAAERGQRPTAETLAQVLSDLRQPLWTRFPDGSATLHATFPLGLNALAKGFIVDKAAETAFAAAGVRAVSVNAGGDLRTLSREGMGGTGLRVQVADPLTRRDDAPPLATVKVGGGALASSGHAHRGYRIGEDWVSHLLDPRTGQPVSGVAGVTVTAPTCLQADALATALSVLGVSGLPLLDALPDCAALLVGPQGERFASSRWATR